MHHFRKTRKKYLAANAADPNPTQGCPLCDSSSNIVIEETTTIRVIANRVPYDTFEGLKTTGKHYMVVPKRHIELLEDFTPQEKIDTFDLLGKYEKQGFNVYARSIKSINRSQRHQHTHLIQTGDKKSKLFFYIRSPHILKVV